MKVDGKPVTPQQIYQYLDRVFNVTAGSTTLTSGAAAKGAYVQLWAASSFDCYEWIIAIWDKAGAGVTDLTVDIATGAAASEVDIIDDLPISLAAGELGVVVYRIPRYVASGARIAARCGITNGGSCKVGIWMVGHT